MYYEESKKNLMALLRQHGCPSLFLTLSCAEFDWPELLKEIAETVYRRKFTEKQIKDLSGTEKKKLISRRTILLYIVAELAGGGFVTGGCWLY